MTRRSRSRRLALQALCCLDVRGEGARGTVDQFVRDSKEPPEVVTAALSLMQQVLADRPACDELLARHARHWELSRLALVDRNILRLAACELRCRRAPYKVVISEALRLAEEFSTAESARFVNGILDSAAKEVRGGKATDAPKETQE